MCWWHSPTGLQWNQTQTEWVLFAWHTAWWWISAMSCCQHFSINWHWWPTMEVLMIWKGTIYVEHFLESGLIFLCFLINHFFYELGWSGNIVTVCAILCSEFLHMTQRAKEMFYVFLHAFQFLKIFTVKVKSWWLVFQNLYFIIDFRTYLPKFCTCHG